MAVVLQYEKIKDHILTGLEEGKWKAIRVDEARKQLTIEAKLLDSGRVTVTTTKEGMVMRWENGGLSPVLRRKRKEP